MSDLGNASREFVVDEHLRITVLTRGAETDGRHDLVIGDAGPGMATALHSHARYEERLFVLAGELTVWAGTEKVRMGPGDYRLIPMNVLHMIQTGPAGARTLNVSSPAAFAELIERTAVPARLAGDGTQLDLELFLAVSAELGDTVLGPPGTIPGELAESPAVTGIHAPARWCPVRRGDHPLRLDHRRHHRR